MRDRLNREIDYMRLSITDRCNLRCKYCMPTFAPGVAHDDLIRYEELLRVCRAAVTLGIHKFKVTGGEPLVRRGAAAFMTELKRLPGVTCVTLTTNGAFLQSELPALTAAGVDAVNISLDTANPALYRGITGSEGVETVLGAVRACAKSGIHTKVNAVLLKETRSCLHELTRLAEELPVDVRFIELMPIGEAKRMAGPTIDEALACLTQVYADLHYVDEKRGNGPAVYYRSQGLLGRVGFIAANSRRFCDRCNRVRLTSTGVLKPCLCYDAGTDILGLMRRGADDGELVRAMKQVIWEKPAAHCFLEEGAAQEGRLMSQIGG